MVESIATHNLKLFSINGEILIFSEENNINRQQINV